MYVCHCRAVTDGAVRNAIDAGAATVPDIARHCGAGTGCGGCWPLLKELLGAQGSFCPAPTFAVEREGVLR